MHSFKATSNLDNKAESILICCFPSKTPIYYKDAIALAKTKAFPYLIINA